MKTKVLWYLIGIGALIIIFLVIFSSLLDVGTRIMDFNKILGYIFYGTAFFLFFVLILNPLRIILFSPSLKIATANERKPKKNKKIYSKVAKNIILNNELSNEEKEKLENYESFDDLKKAIRFTYDTSLKKKINKIIYKNAKTVMLSTAISQNSKLDLYSVLSVNFKMIKEIVVVSGYRPSMRNLSKLSVNVLGTALIAEGLENITIEEILPNSTLSTISEIPFIKPILSSIMQGATNALLTLRIGFVTSIYLFGEAGISKTRIRAEAFKEAMKLLPLITKDVLMFFPTRFVKIFSKRKEKKLELDSY